MRKKLFNLSAIILLTLFAVGVNAQDYCFWIVSNRTQAMNELKVKETTSTEFSADLLPQNAIEPGQAFYIKVTDWSNPLGDVQITDMDGNPMMFHLKTTSGGEADFPYIRINFRDIHTLVLNADNTFSVYNDDHLNLGHPCEN